MNLQLGAGLVAARLLAFAVWASIRGTPAKLSYEPSPESGQAIAVAAREHVALVLSHLHPRCRTNPHAAGIGAGEQRHVLPRDRDSW
jgi:hypothetical protein